MPKPLIFLLLLTALNSWGFVPPVPQMVRDVFDGRKAAPATELIFKHHIELRPGESVDLEEQYEGDVHRGSVLFRAGTAAVAGGAFEKKSYNFGGDRRFPLKSFLARKYLLSASTDDFLGSLIGEHFATKEQMLQFPPTYQPTGEPQTWDVKSNILHPEGIYLKRARGVPSYYVSSAEEGGQPKGVYFDKGLGGIRRIEWKEGSDLFAWNFDAFTKFQSGGQFPRKMSLEKNGVEFIVSELIVHRPAREKQAADFRQTVKTAPSLSGNYEEALRVLLSYR